MIAIVFVILTDAQYQGDVSASDLGEALRGLGMRANGEVRKARQVVDMPTDSADSMQVAS
jgi:hypothetical protein